MSQTNPPLDLGYVESQLKFVGELKWGETPNVRAKITTVAGELLCASRPGFDQIDICKHVVDLINHGLPSVIAALRARDAQIAELEAENKRLEGVLSTIDDALDAYNEPLHIDSIEYLLSWFESQPLSVKEPL